MPPFYEASTIVSAIEAERRMAVRGAGGGYRRVLVKGTKFGYTDEWVPPRGLLTCVVPMMDRLYHTLTSKSRPSVKCSYQKQ